MTLSNTCLIIAIVLLALPCESGWAIDQTLSIEVFTDTSFPELSGEEDAAVYVIDRIDRLQEELSNGLPINPESAKQEAGLRFQSMDMKVTRQLEQAAKGLVRAMQYGIDRYPAVVFDGHAVVYGVTDLNAATRLYQQWQAEAAR